MTPWGRIAKINESFLNKPVFVLTSDQDWASSYCVSSLMDFLQSQHITPTFFVTNECPAVDAMRREGGVELGIHPNFLANTTHGETLEDIIGHLLSIVPTPVAVRCHCFFENSHVLSALINRRLMIDSNICLYLQPNIRPLQRALGMISLPCFWEDDVHWTRGFGWEFEKFRPYFFTPGLKIINVHPFFFTLNTPNADFYARRKTHIPTLDADTAKRLRYDGPGAATFLRSMIAAIHAEGYRITRLSEVIERLAIDWVPV